MDDFDEFLQTVEKNSRESHDHARSALKMVRLARLGRQVERMLPDGISSEDAAVLAFGPKAQEQMRRLREKLATDVPPAKVITAALKHLEWKVDREAEGLRVFAGHPTEAPDEGESDEPWKASG